MTFSLLGRLLLRLTLVTLLSVAVAIGAFLYQFLDKAGTLRDRNLSGQLDDLAGHLAVDDGQVRLRLPAPLALAYAESGGMFRYVVTDSAGDVLLASDPRLQRLTRATPPADGSIDTFRADLYDRGEAQTFYGAARRVALDGRVLFVEVAQGPEHGDVLADEFLEELWRGAGLIAIAVFALLAAVIYLTLRRALAPIERASRQARAIGPERTDLRIAEAGLPSEIAPLVGGMNQALDRLAAGYVAQQRFTADAAHELRTPIAVLRAHLESLDDAGTRARLLPDVDRLERIVQQLLLLQQADNLAVPATAVADLAQVARDTAAMLAPIVLREGRGIELLGGEQPLRVAGDAAFLELAVRNLVENALAVTPPGGTVTIRLEPPAALAVQDQGPGVPLADRERIFERFWRRGGERWSGAGLGLSIVQRIAVAHGGRIEIAGGPGAGAVFTLRLRPPSPAVRQA
jgi:signal transduction histidine kinase